MKVLRVASIFILGMVSVVLFAAHPKIEGFSNSGLYGAAQAQSAGLDENEKTAYRAKLSQAEKIDKDLAIRIGCIERHDAALEKQSADLQIQLGGLRRKEQDLTSQKANAESRFNDFRRQYSAADDLYRQKSNEYRRLQAQLDAQRRALKECKRSLDTGGVFNWFTDATCDLSLEINRLVGILPNVEGAMNSAKRQLQIHQQTLNGQRNLLNRAQSDLQTAQRDLARTTNEIRQVEDGISRTKLALTDLRGERRTNRLLLDAFATILAEANTVDTEGGRRRTRIHITQLSPEIDKLIANSSAVIAGANAVLPDNGRSCVEL